MPIDNETEEHMDRLRKAQAREELRQMNAGIEPTDAQVRVHMLNMLKADKTRMPGGYPSGQK